MFTYQWYWTLTRNYACRQRVQSRAFTRFQYEDLSPGGLAVQACQEICDNEPGCNYVSFTSNYYPCHTSPSCTFEKLLTANPGYPSDVYANPRVNFVQQPILSTQIDHETGQLVGVAAFGIKPQARGLVQMLVFGQDSGENIGAKLQESQAEADKNVAQAKAEMRRAAAVALEQEMKARVEEMNAKVVEAEAQVPLALAEAFRSGNLGVMDYYRMNNIKADTDMRDSISKGEESN